MEITIKITESPNGKPSITVTEGDNPNSKSENSSKKNNSKEEKTKKSNVRTEKELRKRLEWLTKLRDMFKAKIESGEEIPSLTEGSSKTLSVAEARGELGFLERVISEYAWVLREEVD